MGSMARWWASFVPSLCVVGLGLSAGACSDDGASMPTEVTTDASSSTTSSTSAGPTVADGTGSSSTGVGSTGSDSTGTPFVPEVDQGLAFRCDVFAQDCPRGHKCTEWASDGGSTWNATKCVPVVDDPAGTGEPCHVEGSPLSGIDDCDHGAICLEVDPQTLEGTCTPFCVGSPEDPACVDEDRFCPQFADGAIVFCVPICSPLLDDCEPGRLCVPKDEHWMCSPDASGGQGAYGDGCIVDNGCDPGLVCVPEAAVPPGLPCEGMGGCCTEVCDVSDPAGDDQCSGAAAGQTCQPWYEPGTAPLDLESVGVCALP